MTTTTLKPQKSKRTVKSFFPILKWLPKYQKSWFRPDVIAALTLWALLVPEAMAYAGIAGMPPQTGLYAAPLALLGYAIFGTSRHLNVGPSSTVAALSLSVVVGFAAVGSDEFVTLTVILALLTGILMILGGLLRLGVLADFLSRPVLDGFVVGVAITVAVGQLDKLLGFEPEHPILYPRIACLPRQHQPNPLAHLHCGHGLSGDALPHAPLHAQDTSSTHRHGRGHPGFLDCWALKIWAFTSSAKSLPACHPLACRMG